MAIKLTIASIGTYLYFKFSFILLLLLECRILIFNKYFYGSIEKTLFIVMIFFFFFFNRRKTNKKEYKDRNPWHENWCNIIYVWEHIAVYIGNNK